jgi:universal stress protein E
MDRIANILAIVDPTVAKQPAVDKAAILASHLNASIELLACDSQVARALRSSYGISDDANDSTMGLQPMLDRVAAPLRAQGVDVATHIVSGDPLHLSVLNFLHNSTADLVLKDTHHHSIAKRTFLTNTDWHLIRECPLPLLLCKARPWGKHLVVAAAIDPVDYPQRSALLDERILDCATALAKTMHAEVHAIHACFPATIAEKAANAPRVALLAAQFAVPSQCIHIDMGVPAEYLPRIAQECNVDIMVMGAISRSHLKQALIGSTAERVLDHLPCDALVVKSPNFGDLPF